MAINYAIANWADKEALTQEKQDELIAGIIEDNWDSCRRTISGTDKFVSKWEGETCPFETVSLTHTDYSHAEILVEMKKSEWSSGEE